MPEPLPDVIAELRHLLLDAGLRRAVAAGRRRGVDPPVWKRVELRPVRLKAGPALQEIRHDERSAHTRNLHDPREVALAVEDLLAQPWGNWHIESAAGTVQMRVTKSGEAMVHRAAPADPGPPVEPALRDGPAHDRVKNRLLPPDDPLFTILGADAAKRRQVDAFLRLLAAELDVVGGRDPLHVVDLGCGHAYLSFAAHRYLTARGTGAVHLTGVDVREAARARNTALAAELGADGAQFVAGTIAQADVPPADVVLALHTCDTATDDALARAVRWRAPLILAAPCCHHETAATLRTVPPPPGYGPVLRHGILRERLADVLTDGLRALILRMVGYRVDVVEFISSEHTARNIAIRAVRTEAPPTLELIEEYRALIDAWQLRPRLAVLLATELTERQ